MPLIFVPIDANILAKRLSCRCGTDRGSARGALYDPVREISRGMTASVSKAHGRRVE